MAAEILQLAGVTPVLPDDLPVGPDASPRMKADWCSARARHCVRQARLCRRLGLPIDKWVRAVRLFRFARDTWRARARRLS